MSNMKKYEIHAQLFLYVMQSILRPIIDDQRGVCKSSEEYLNENVVYFGRKILSYVFNTVTV